MSTQSEYQPAYFLVSDLVDLLGRKMYTWEHDMLFIMRLTHSDHWIGATRNSKHEPNGRTFFGRFGVQGVEWQMVHEDNLLVSPGVYMVNGEKGKRLFVNFIGRRRYEFPLFDETESNGILREVFKGVSYTDAIEIVSGVPMKDLDDRMWKELKILPV
jgi:hypothetical protein